eukprot:scaffold165588_cov32-Prasinocladus_malaysianus.AAC.1
MAKPKKSTKKFQRKVQKGSIQKRKKHHAGKSKRESPAEKDEVHETATETQPTRKVEDLSIDEFLDGGFEMSDDDELEDNGNDDSLQDDSGDEDDEQVEVQAGPQIAEDEESSEDGMLFAFAIHCCLIYSSHQAFIGPMRMGDSTDMHASPQLAHVKDESEIGKENTKLASEVSRHKRELDALKERDPEFYAYLQATDKELLDFEGSDDDEEESQDEEGSQDGEADAKEEPPALT